METIFFFDSSLIEDREINTMLNGTFLFGFYYVVYDYSLLVKTSNEMKKKKKLFSDIITCIYVNFNRTHNNTAFDY